MPFGVWTTVHEAYDFFFFCYQGPRQQGDGVPPDAGGGRVSEEEGRRGPLFLRVLLPLPTL